MLFLLISAVVLGVALALIVNLIYLMFLGVGKPASKAAVAAIACALGITLVTGFFPQTREGWPFILIWTVMTALCGLAAITRLLRFKPKEIPFLLNHLGVFVAIATATLGSAHVQKLKMTVYYENPQWRALSHDEEVVEPGITIELHQFTADYYEDGAPKRFASDISVYTEDGKSLRGTVEVNKPLKVNGWKIYQYGYDNAMGSKSPYSVLMLVKDPWLPAVYCGVFLMLSGAVSLLFLRKAPRRKWVLLSALLLTGFFTFLTISRMGPSARALPPALQSPWFVPHLVVYMAGYALLATATVLSVYQLLRKTDAQMALTDNLVYVGLAFLTFGMLFGALWAKDAWGHYWTWDPKETWAAITWLCCLLYIHFRALWPGDGRKACWILLLAFLCLQFCWWGINYLPSARGLSTHIYM